MRRENRYQNAVSGRVLTGTLTQQNRGPSTDCGPSTVVSRPNMRPSHTILTLFFALTMAPLTAQNIDAIGRGKALSLSGNVSLSQVSYLAQAGGSNRDKSNFVASGNINASVYGWRLPLSFTFSDHHSRFTQPFNRFAIHPRWRSVSLHVGNTSMSFSPYTVNGHTFRGVGVDLDPGEKWRFSALYGRFMKAAVGDTTQNLPATFRRTGGAIRAGFHAVTTTLELIVFHAVDDRHSIDLPGDTALITPQQNSVVSIRGSKTFLKRLALRGGLATTAVTRDTRAPKGAHHPLAGPLRFAPANSTTSVHRAIKTSAEYQSDDWSAGISYERIDPGYKTFGAYYFNDDIQHLTAQGMARIAGEKLTVSVRAGVQRDNLNGAKHQSLQRIATAGSVHYAPSRTAHVTAAWSSFQTVINLRPSFGRTFGNRDTVSYTQISRNMSLSAGLSHSENRRLTLNATLQETADQVGDGAVLANAQASYTHALGPNRTVFTATLQGSLSRNSLSATYSGGPSTAVIWNMLNQKLRASWTASWNRISDGFAALNGRLHCLMMIGKSHRFTANMVCTRRHFPQERPATWEFTAMMGYHWTW